MRIDWHGFSGGVLMGEVDRCWCAWAAISICFSRVRLAGCAFGGVQYAACHCIMSPALRAVALYAYRPPFARKTSSEFASACLWYVEWTAQFIRHIYIHNGRIRHFYVFMVWNAGISFERIGDRDKDNLTLVIFSYP